MVSLTWIFVLCGCSVVFSEKNYLLMVLLGVEVVSVGLYGVLSWVVLSSGISSNVSLVFLTFAVCEAVLGLSALISSVRGFGSEKSSSIFVVKYWGVNLKKMLDFKPSNEVMLHPSGVSEGSMIMMWLFYTERMGFTLLCYVLISGYEPV